MQSIPIYRNLDFLFRWVLLLLVVVQSLSAQAGPPKAKSHVDRRIEAVSIAFFLAGNKEYGQSRDTTYLESVRDHFSAWKDHPAVRTAARLRDTKQVWMGAPANLACHLGEDLVLAPDANAKTAGGSLDFRFTLQEARDFASELQDFASKSQFDAFMLEHQDRFARAEAGLQPLLDRMELSWFSDGFLDSGENRFQVSVSLMIGPNNYGVVRKTPKGLLANPVIGVWSFDEKGYARFGPEVWEVLLHEFSHPCFNPLIDAHIGLLRAPAQALAKARSEDFKRTGYGEDGYDDDLIYESLAWAGAILYTEQHEGRSAAETLTAKVAGRGWTWLPEVIDWMRDAKKAGYFRRDARKAMRLLGDVFTRCARHRNRP